MLPTESWLVERMFVVWLLLPIVVVVVVVVDQAIPIVVEVGLVGCWWQE